MTKSAAVVGIATIIAMIAAFFLPGTAVATSTRDNLPRHVIYRCVTVRDRAKSDTGKICINAFMNPLDEEWHFRARLSFRSVSGGKLSRSSASTLYLRLGGRDHGIRHKPKASSKHGATVFRIVNAWIADPHDLNPTAVVKNACMTWRNGGRACRNGFLRGGTPAYVSGN